MRWMAGAAAVVLLLASTAGVASADSVQPVVSDSQALGEAPHELPAATSSSANTGAERRVARLLRKRWHDPRIGRDFAMIVLEAGSGRVVAAHHPDRPQQPASNMKLVTAVTALATMGAGHRMPTTVVRGSTRRHIVLRGGGDPLLSIGDLRRLADRTIAARGRGRVVVDVDASMFGRASDATGWRSVTVGNSVGSVRALGLVGDRSRVSHRRAAEWFVGALRSRGVDARLGSFGATPANAPVLARVRGHTVGRAVAVMLIRSDSMVAEVLFRHVALARNRQPTWRGGQRAAVETVIDLGLDLGRSRLVDGSGLSQDDALTPRFVATMLRRVLHDPVFAAMFRPSAMPIAGRTGTLATRFGRYTTWPSRCATGRVQAKTGTVPRTIALSGVARAGKARRVFSMIVNHRPLRGSELDTRRALDGLAATVSGCWR